MHDPLTLELRLNRSGLSSDLRHDLVDLIREHQSLQDERDELLDAAENRKNLESEIASLEADNQRYQCENDDLKRDLDVAREMATGLLKDVSPPHILPETTRVVSKLIRARIAHAFADLPRDASRAQMLEAVSSATDADDILAALQSRRST